MVRRDVEAYAPFGSSFPAPGSCNRALLSETQSSWSDHHGQAENRANGERPLGPHLAHLPLEPRQPNPPVSGDEMIDGAVPSPRPALFLGIPRR